MLTAGHETRDARLLDDLVIVIVIVIVIQIRTTYIFQKPSTHIFYSMF